MIDRDESSEKAEGLFKLGEDRLGLIVILRGEGEEARYGYEIQPIREYFTAAYIDEQVIGDADKIFASVIRRPYWKEVALFLAGLRRPKEKADLLMRAKALDKEDHLDWRQDGRNIVLQLLLEGAFSEPPHILSEALEFVFDLLDVNSECVQNEPQELLQSLSSLLRQHRDKSGVRKLVSRLDKLISELRESSDLYAVRRLYTVANSTFSESEFREVLLSHQCTSPRVIAKVKLEYSCSWNVDIKEATKDNSFWDGVPDHLWAESWWRVYMRRGKVTNFSPPFRLHQSLAIHFATNSISQRGYGQMRRLPIEPQSNWAIWLLVSYQHILQTIAINISHSYYTKGSSKLKIDIDPPNIDHAEYDGLDEDLVPVVNRLLTICHSIVNNLLSAAYPNIDKYATEIVTYIDTPGLIGWIGCECAKNILNVLILKRKLIGSFANEASNDTSEISSKIKCFYTGFENSNSQVDEDFLFEGSIRDYIISNLSPSKVPPIKKIRIKDGSLVSVTEILLDYVVHEKPLPFEWLVNIPLTNETVKFLVKRCVKLNSMALPKMLKSISDLLIPHTSSTYPSPLIIQDINRILKIVRIENDPDTLRGALIALSSSKFIKSAGSDLTLKLIQNNYIDADLISSLLFANRYDSRREIDSKEAKVICTVAKKIITMPSDYSFKVVCSAASYLFESEPLVLQPLIEEEDALMLKVRRA